MITRQWQCDVEIVVQAASKMSAADESPAFWLRRAGFDRA